MTTPLNRTDLEDAIDILSRGAGRLGEPVLATTLAVLRERLASDAADPLAGRGAAAADEQRKQVTILFASVDGLTARTQRLSEEQRVPFINQLWTRLDDIVAFHGGLVDKHMGDVVMCLFGVPVAGENDAERAVRCALAMSESIAEVAAEPTEGALVAEPLSIRIGVNTGLVVLGQLGTDDVLTVIGDPVNVASRLKDAAAESGVYISHETYRLVETLFRVEPLGLLPVRGRRTPVTVFRAVGARPRAFFPTRLGVRGVSVPMVGRLEEMESLQLAVAEALQTGHGRFITVIGDPGVGKSRLVGEFSRQLESFPVRPRVLLARGDSRLQTAPLGLIRQLADDLAQLTEGGALAGRPGRFGAAGVSRPRAQGQLQAGLRWPGRAAVAATRTVPAGPPGSVEPTTDADGFIEQLGRLAGHNAITVVFVEDVHWSDDESLHVLERIARLARQAPLVIICMARPILLERRPDWPKMQIRLRPLGTRESHELVRHILRHLAMIPDELSDLIVRAGGGNPYFVEELIKVMIDDGLIVAGEGEWILRPGRLPRLRVPATLTGVLQARLDRLPEAERVTLQQAAVIGDEFWDTAVHYLNQAARRPTESGRLAVALQSLEAQELIYRIDSRLPDAAAYRFTHAALFEVAYDSVLLRDRPAYHLAAARWLDMESEGLGAEYAAEIARHYERGAEVGRAAAAYQQAAAWAESRRNVQVAIDCYRKVLALAGELPQFIDRRLRAHERLGDNLRRQGALDEALASYQSMRDIAELDGNLLMHARAENALATLSGDRYEPAGMLAHARRAARVAWLSGSERDFIQALLNQSEAEALSGYLGQAIDLAEEAAQIALIQDMDLEIVRSLALLGRWQALTGNEAGTTAARLLSAAERLQMEGRTDAAALGRCLAARLALQRGAVHEATRPAISALEAIDQVVDRDLAAESLLILAQVGLAAGDAAGAVTTFEAAQTAADAAGHVLFRRHAELGLAEALLFSGRPAEAHARLKRILDSESDGWQGCPVAQRAEATALLAMVLLDERDAAAADVAATALEMVSGAGSGTGVPAIVMAAMLAASGEALMAAPSGVQPMLNGEELTAIACFERAANLLDAAAAGAELAHRRRRLLLAWADAVERQGLVARAAGLRVRADESPH